VVSTCCGKDDSTKARKGEASLQKKGYVDEIRGVVITQAQACNSKKNFRQKLSSEDGKTLVRGE